MEPITRRETLLNQIADNTSGNTGSIDMEPITREEVYLKAIADNTASGDGGGSSLPAVTSEDNGDVLTVVDGAWDKAAPSGLPAVTGADIGKSMVVQRGAASAGAVIVPQQTVSEEGEGTYLLSNVVTDLFTVRRCVQVTYGDTTEIGFVVDSGGGELFVDLPSGGSLGYSADLPGWAFWYPEAEEFPETLTIFANEASFAADWDKAYPYDMGVEIDLGNRSGEIVFGTYVDVMAKLKEGRPVSISVSSGLARYNPVCVSCEDGVISVAIINLSSSPIDLIWMDVQSDGTITFTIPT